MSMNVVIAGAGPAALETALALRHHAPDRVALTLVAPDGDFVYRPISVAEPFAMGRTRRYPLGAIAADLQATHVDGTLAGVDADAHEIHLAAGSPVTYDVLVVAVGAHATPVFPRATTFGGPEDAEIMHGLVQDVEMGYVFGPRGSAVVAEMLAEAGVRLHVNAPAMVEDFTAIVLRSGQRLEVDRVVSLPTLAGPAIKGLPHDGGGFLPVDRLGSVRSVHDVYAAGDATDFPVKQGGLATQQADAVASAIAARAGARVTPQPFEPVLHGMLLTEDHPRWLRDEAAAHGEVAAAEYGLWWPPTKIAGLWLGPYLLRRDMAAAGSSRAAVPIEARLDHRTYALDATA